MTDSGEIFESSYVIAASKYDYEYLESVGDGTLFTTDYHQGEAYTTIETAVVSRGRTPISGLYLAGHLAHDKTQVQEHAGHGVTAGQSLITDHRRERGFPDELASAYCDWAVIEDGYGGDDWESELREQFNEAIESESSLSDNQIKQLREEWVREHREWELTTEEQEQKRTEGQRALARQLDDQILLDSVDDELIREYATDLDRETE